MEIDMFNYLLKMWQGGRISWNSEFVNPSGSDPDG